MLMTTPHRLRCVRDVVDAHPQRLVEEFAGPFGAEIAVVGLRDEPLGHRVAGGVIPDEYALHFLGG